MDRWSLMPLSLVACVVGEDNMGVAHKVSPLVTSLKVKINLAKANKGPRRQRLKVINRGLQVRVQRGPTRFTEVRADPTMQRQGKVG